MPMGGGGNRVTKRIVTVFSNQEFLLIKAFCDRKKTSVYALAKAAIREYVKRHP